MCISDASCLCHLIKPAILTDKNEKFLSFFSQSHNDEFYYFLKNSYDVLEYKNDEKQAIEKINTLRIRFIAMDSHQEINIPIQLKRSFLDQYDFFVEGDSDIQFVKKSLANIVTKAEKIIYENFSIQFKEFDAYVKHYQNNPIIANIANQNPESEIELMDDDSCYKCSLF